MEQKRGCRLSHAQNHAHRAMKVERNKEAVVRRVDWMGVRGGVGHENGVQFNRWSLAVKLKYRQPFQTEECKFNSSHCG